MSPVTLHRPIFQAGGGNRMGGMATTSVCSGSQSANSEQLQNELSEAGNVLGILQLGTGRRDRKQLISTQQANWVMTGSAHTTE